VNRVLKEEKDLMMSASCSGGGGRKKDRNVPTLWLFRCQIILSANPTRRQKCKTDCLARLLRLQLHFFIFSNDFLENLADLLKTDLEKKFLSFLFDKNQRMSRTMCVVNK
jgi:hypothetical protein